MNLPLAIFASATACAAAQAASFVNLDFELANTNGSSIEFRRNVAIPPGPGLFPFGTGPVDQLLPGWQVYVGDQRTNTVAIGNGFFELAFSPLPSHAGLIIPGGLYAFPFKVQPDGIYALLLDNFRRTNLRDNARVSVVQTGDVPLDAQSLTFRKLNFGTIGLIVDTNIFPDTVLTQDSSDPTRFSFDISPWAGKTATIGFSSIFDSTYVVDSIAFVVPEPSMYPFCILGAAAFAALSPLAAWSRRDRRKCGTPDSVHNNNRIRPSNKKSDAVESE